MKKNILILLAIPILMVSCRNLTDDDTYSSELKKQEAEARDDDIKANTVLATETLTAKIVDFYSVGSEGIKCEPQMLTLYFDQDGEIPFVEVKSFLNEISGPEEILVKKEGKKYILSRPWNENYYLTLDFSTGEAAYSDYEYFCAYQAAGASCDPVWDDTVLKRWKIMDIRGEKAYSRNLNDYGIPYKFEGGHGFIPLDVLELLLNYGIHIAYNGEAIFADTDAAYGLPAYSQKFSNPKETWSEVFGKYMYNYLCLAMDMKYGRKAYKGITTFDNWLTASGLKEKLCSTNIKESETALGTMLLLNIGDLHSNYIHVTPFLGVDSAGILYSDPRLVPLPVNTSPSEARIAFNGSKLKTLMSNQPKFMYCDTGAKGYKVNNTDKDDKIMNIFIPRNTGTGITNQSKLNTIFLTFFSFDSLYGYDKNYKKKWAYQQIGGKTKNDGVHFYVSTGGAALTEITTPANYTVDKFIADINANTGNGYGISFDNEGDTILLTVVSNYIIKQLANAKKEDKVTDKYTRKIENVVLDLSRNGGGMNDDEAIITSWFLGQTDNHTKNTITGSSSTVSFIADIDFDGTWNNLNQYAEYERTKDPSKINDPDDTICNLKRYCITSLYSFSCGNLMPSHVAFKDTVTLIGQTSGGGTCVLQNIEMPSGTRICTSSPSQLSTLVNGAPVDIDAGITPDVSVGVNDFGTIYNRETFCETYIY